MKSRLVFFTSLTLILGVLIGTGFGLLYAPRAGLYTRAIVHNQSVQYQAQLTRDIHLAGIQSQSNVTKDVHIAGIQVQAWLGNFIKGAGITLTKFGNQLKTWIGSIPFLKLTWGH